MNDQQIDLDVFSKKREFKYNEDNLQGPDGQKKQNAADNTRHSNLIDQSARKPLFPPIGKVIEVNKKQVLESTHNLD